MILIPFLIQPLFQDFPVGNELQVLPDGITDQPGKRIEPVEDTEQLRQQYIYRMPLPDMYIFMQDNGRIFFFRMQLLVDIDGIPKRKWNNGLVYLENLHPRIADQPGLSADPPERTPSDQEPDQQDHRPLQQRPHQNMPSYQSTKKTRLPDLLPIPPDQGNIQYQGSLKFILLQEGPYIDQRDNKRQQRITQQIPSVEIIESEPAQH